MNTIPNEQHVRFYEWQIQILEEAWLRYANTPMNTLWMSKKLFVGRIWGIQHAQGNVILRFKAGALPRIKNHYLLSLVTPDLGHNPASWSFSYLEFRSSTQPRLSGKNTEVKPVYLLKSEDPKWVYVAVSNFDHALFNDIETQFLSQKQHPLVVLAETDPPVDYLLKLKEFVSRNPRHPILNLDLLKRDNEWRPTNLDNQGDISPQLINLIEANHTILVQGPPGTGKSYLAAQICSDYLQKDKTVAVTALTNKALVEVVGKEPLAHALLEGNLFKTNLSADEKKQFPLGTVTK